MPHLHVLASTPPSGLEQLWFVLIAVLWLGYFFLEGFDFGVGILLPFLSRDDMDRRVMINTIGPVWDGNEVWLLTAGGATFAAFPLWYATVFSGFYLALFLVLAALIFRGMAFEFRGKRDDPRGGPGGTERSSGVRRCRRCSGASPSPTSFTAYRSRPVPRGRATSSTSSSRTRYSAASRHSHCSPCTARRSSD